MKIAVTGKGGAGKTTIAATLARILGRRDQRVLALDADSNPNLAVPLGLSREQATAVEALPYDLAEWREDAHGKAYVELREPLAQVIAGYGTAAPDGVSLLVMGNVEHAGAGCRCNAHAAARGISRQLVSEANMAVLDMEAGLEHLGRGTVEHVDILLIVVEPYYRALETATRIRDLAVQLAVPRIVVVGNRIRRREDQEAVDLYCRNHLLDLIGSIPYDDAILAAEQRGLAPIDFAPDSPAVHAIANLATTLLDGQA